MSRPQPGIPGIGSSALGGASALQVGTQFFVFKINLRSFKSMYTVQSHCAHMYIKQ